MKKKKNQMLYINVMEINYNNIWGIEIYTKHLQPSFYEHPCFQQPEKEIQIFI